MKQTTSRSLSETLSWISENNHHRGYWTAGEEFFVLEGNAARLRIPVDIHVPGMMEADEWTETGKMYRPSEAGRRALSNGVRPSDD